MDRPRRSLPGRVIRKRLDCSATVVDKDSSTHPNPRETCLGVCLNDVRMSCGSLFQEVTFRYSSIITFTRHVDVPLNNVPWMETFCISSTCIGRIQVSEGSQLEFARSTDRCIRMNAKRAVFLAVFLLGIRKNRGVYPSSRRSIFPSENMTWRVAVAGGHARRTSYIDSAQSVT